MFTNNAFILYNKGKGEEIYAKCGGRKSNMRTQVAAIEFGTSKIVTVIAESGGFNRCDIVGSGTVPYDGYFKGEWITPERLAQAVYNSISAAEKDANCKIKDIYIGVPCEMIQVKNAKATVPVHGEQGKVSEEDIDDVQDMAANVFRFEQYENVMVLHRSPAWFALNDGRHTMLPLNMHGENLSACVSFILADNFFVRDMTDLMSSMGIIINGFLSPSFGEQLLLTTSEEREKICAFIDVGFLHTEVSVLEGDAMVYHAVIPEGGAKLTQALAKKLDIRDDEAEYLKRCFVLGTGGFEILESPDFAERGGIPIGIDLDLAKLVMQKSVDELCDTIDRTLDDAGKALKPRSTVYLTGGGLALLRGGKEYLSSVLRRPVKVPQLKAAKLNSPIYSRAMGLIDLVFDSIEQRSMEQDKLPGRIADGLRSLLFKG